MSYQYASFPKVKLSFPTTNLSYCYIKYVGNTTATSTVVYSGKLTGGAYTSNDLSLNTLYTFTLTPLDSTDVSGIVKTITVDTTPKNSGTKNTTGRSTYEATTLQWGGTSYDYYKVSRSLKGTTAYTDISTNVAQNVYYDNDLSGNSIYYYYVTPYKNDGTAYTAATPIYIYTNVRAPTDMSSTVYDSSSITMTWKTKNSYDTSYYNVVYVKNNTTGAILTASGDIQSYTMKDLSKNTTYTCYAQTYLLSMGSTVTATTASPYVGGNITLYSVSMNSITVSWTGQYLDYVTVSRRVGTTASYTDICGADYASPYVDGDISGNTTYYYYVTPKLGLFSGSASSVVSSTTPVAYPTDVSATFYDMSAIKLAFTAPKNTYYLSNGSPYYYAKAVYQGNTYTSSSSTTSPILIQNLSSSTSYSCYILTYVDGALGSTSSALSVTTNTTGVAFPSSCLFGFDTGSGLTTSSGYVTSWVDKRSGNSVTLSSSGSYRPTTSTINGTTVINFSTSGTCLYNSAANISGIGSYTYIFVCYFLSNTTNAQIISHNVNTYGGSNGFDITVYGATNAVDFAVWGKTTYWGNRSSSMSTNTAYIFTVNMVYSSSTSPYYTYTFRINGVLDKSYTYSGVNVTQNLTSIEYGNSGPGNTINFPGYLGDHYLFNRSLSSTEVSNVENYLSYKYQIAVGSPSSIYTQNPFTS